MADTASGSEWLTTEAAAASVGMTAEWVRGQIYAKRLVATAISTGRRRTYRIRAADWASFCARYTPRTDAPDWE